MTTIFETDPITAHISALGSALRGPATVRRSMLAEARDGLEDAAAAYQEGGLGPREAAGRAVHDFGSVTAIAPLYQEELTARQGRRTAFLLATAFPGMMLAWDLLWRSGISWHAATPPPSEFVGVLARTQDVTSVVVGALALLLLVVTFRRDVPQRRIAVAVGLTAVIGSALTLTTCLLMHAANTTGAASMLAAGLAAPTAYLSSVMVLLVIVRSATRTLRLTRLRPELAA